MERSATIRWHAWGPAAFERARAEGKLVFLDISATWCHWCHVLDRTSLSDPRVVALLEASYLPVRVDTDRRPDINERYNQGGWPTTAVLLPDGRLIAGATYLPPDALLELLARCADAWRDGRDRIERHLLESDIPAREAAPGAADLPSDGPRPEELALVAHSVLAQYDPVHPGFFREPKFPLAEILLFLRDGWIMDANREMGETLVRILRTMGGSGIHDPVGGGFFRYATRRDWSEPHYEKLLGDNADLLALYASAWERTGDPSFSAVAGGILRFLLGTLHDPETGAFFSSQDADEAFYRLPPDERARRAPPAVDRTVISEYNGRAASALAAAHAAFGTRPAGDMDAGRLLERAERVARHLREALWSPGEGQLRFREGDAAEAGHLADNVAAATAHLDLWDATGERAYLDFSGEALDWTVRRLFSAKEPGFLDRRPRDGDAANLAAPVVPFTANARAACALIRYAREAARPDLFAVAEQVLAGLSAERDRRAAFGAPYGSALLLHRQGLRGAACRPGDPSCP